MYSFRFLINYLSHFANALVIRHRSRSIPSEMAHALRESRNTSQFEMIERYRSELYLNSVIIEEKNPGAGTRSHRRSVGQMAAVTSVNDKYGRLLFNLAACHRPDLIIELGTAFGISTMYMAAANPEATVITVEGNSQLAAIATEGFRKNNFENITLINRPFHDVTDHLISLVTANTMVFIDGNHTFEATLSYFNAFSQSSCIIFDDINWSTGMMKAWNRIKSSPAAGTVIDLFWMGIIFPHNEKRNLKVWY